MAAWVQYAWGPAILERALFNGDKPEPVLRGNFTVPRGLHTGEVAVINGHTYELAARDPSGPAMMVFDITGIVP